jgi:hypothetical protein
MQISISIVAKVNKMSMLIDINSGRFHNFHNVCVSTKNIKKIAAGTEVVY